MKAEEVVEALRKRHGIAGMQWAFFGELRAGTGYAVWNYKEGKHFPNNPEQRFDAWAINLYPSKKHERIAYEIKVSRADFLHEIKNPEKRQQALSLSNYFYFAVPKGLVSVEEIPEECGLIEVNEDLTSRIKKKAPYRDTELATWQFLCAIARRAVKAEDEVKRLHLENRALYEKINQNEETKILK